MKPSRPNTLRLLLPAICLFAACTLLLSSCKESIPTEIDLEPEPGPIEDLRTWSLPERIDVAPVDQFASNPITSISTSNQQDLHLSLIALGDTLVEHDFFRLTYLHYDGSTWTHQTDVDGLGLFKPATSINTPDGRQHFFWAGVAPEHRQSPATARVTDLFYCVWDGAACSEPVSLFASGVLTHFYMDQAVVDHTGAIHLVFNYQTGMYHLVMPPGGSATVTRIEGSSYPSLRRKDEALYLVWVSFPSSDGGSNDVFYRAYRDGGWTPVRNIFHHVQRSAHVPALAIDHDGTHHLVFHAEVGNGPQVDLLYMVSRDEGATWSAPEVLYSTRSFFSDPPVLVVDAFNVVHLRFSHWGVLPFIDNFYMTLREGVWLEPVVLFPGHPSRTAALITVDGSNRLHAVWKSEDALYHARFE